MYCPVAKTRWLRKKKPFDQKRIVTFSRDVLKGKVFGFAQMHIEVPDELYDKFSEMATLFIVQEIVMWLKKLKSIRKKLEEKQ